MKNIVVKPGLSRALLVPASFGVPGARPAPALTTLRVTHLRRKTKNGFFSLTKRPHKKPFNNLDELLYQFYINLDSDCLFKMPVAELEKVWGIKILDKERFKPKNYYPFSETEFYYKPYKTEKDAFYVEMSSGSFSGNRFELKITKEYFERHGTLFPDEKLPKLLPQPNSDRKSDNDTPPCKFPDFIKILSISGKQEETCYSHMWWNSDRSIKLISPDKVLIEKKIKTGEKLNRIKMPDKSRPETLDAERQVGNVPCRGLKPYKDIYELMYQFYINLDSDCLFKMPLKELEEIWDTKIYAMNFSPVSSPVTSADFEEKPYNTERDAFYIGAIKDNDGPYVTRFWIRMTRDFARKKRGLISDGIYLSMLPKPHGKSGRESFYAIWWNSDKTQLIKAGHHIKAPGVTDIIVESSALHPDDAK